ncbi:hypothetical protein [uncultured Oscillibacter sp.]|uniref:hypothetical protein n=1 Tax=uncultured Oscillibacter sp. TaxID=876091 RepID=UPI0025DBB0AD|nr:hypothetical protein [uncultured Oscillibacter sp.]
MPPLIFRDKKTGEAGTQPALPALIRIFKTSKRMAGCFDSPLFFCRNGIRCRYTGNERFQNGDRTELRLLF